MNDHGERMDDPVEGKPLPLMGDNHAQAGFAQVPEAFEKCRHLMPATWRSSRTRSTPSRSAGTATACAGTASTYPQPDATGMVRYPADPSVLGRPEYQSADAACRYVIDDSADSGAGE
jgi:hypothetical protein